MPENKTDPLPHHAKFAEVLGVVLVNIIAALAEVAAVLVAAYLLFHGKLSQEVAVAIIGIPLVGPGIRRATGKPVVTTTVLAFGTLTSLIGSGVASEVAKRMLLTVGLCLTLGLSGCAWFNENAKPVLRTVVEVARHLCLLTAEEQHAAARDGLTPAQFCEAEQNLRPFIDEVLAAKQRASGATGLTSGDEQ